MMNMYSNMPGSGGKPSDLTVDPLDILYPDFEFMEVFGMRQRLGDYSLLYGPVLREIGTMVSTDDGMWIIAAEPEAYVLTAHWEMTTVGERIYLKTRRNSTPEGRVYV